MNWIDSREIPPPKYGLFLALIYCTNLPAAVYGVNSDNDFGVRKDWYHIFRDDDESDMEIPHRAWPNYIQYWMPFPAHNFEDGEREVIPELNENWRQNE